MPLRQAGDRTEEALIVFADIIDSSKYSAVLGYEQYAQRLLGFQQTFTDLGHRYFPRVEDKTVQFCRVDARGDEGIIFLLCPQGAQQAQKATHILRAIEFLYHLKARLRFGGDTSGSETAPRRFDVGAGIHWGKVVFILTEEDHHSVIGGIEGFDINYAKRVESCSREGRHSRILLSTEAARYIELEPIVLTSFRTAMKGISDDVELHEVQAGLLDHMELRSEDEGDQLLIDQAERLCSNPMGMESSWEKALVVSVLERICKSAPVPADKAKRRRMQYDLAWHSVKEDDPILLYLRSRDCRESGQRTRELRYLRSILRAHPHFVHARLLMVKACWALAQGKAEREEKLFARDTAKEFLDHHRSLLNDEQKADFRRLLDSCTPGRKRTRRKPRPPKA